MLPAGYRESADAPPDPRPREMQTIPGNPRYDPSCREADSPSAGETQPNPILRAKRGTNQRSTDIAPGPHNTTSASKKPQS